MGDTQTHLAAWESAGVIDGTTAQRIREFDAASTPAPTPERGPSAIATIFGPSVAIGELFGYLGAGFLIAASDAFLVRIAGPAPSNEAVLAIGAAVQATVLFAIGWALRTDDPRRSRAAGVAFVAAVIHAGAAGGFAAQLVGLEWPASGVVGAGGALALAVVTRLVHPALLTHAAVLGALTSLSATILALLEQTLFPPPDFVDGEVIARSGPDPIILVVASAAWWLVTALVIGLIGLREAGRARQDDTAGRRAGLSRIWAGLVAVIGLATAVTQSAPLANGEYGRILEPWVGELAILILSAILIERAFRRDDSAFVYPAALGLIIALTDFNVSYLAGGTELGLLVEGLILLAVGFAAQRLRRMIGAPRDGDPENGQPAIGIEPSQEARPEP